MEKVQADNAAELEAEIEKADTELKEYDKDRQRKVNTQKRKKTVNDNSFIA
ncbi:MAG: hypothetical protein J6O40_05275 [Ruminococcus sp.]|nr:hypothetical protein [Ruminococcus sp.]